MFLLKYLVHYEKLAIEFIFTLNNKNICWVRDDMFGFQSDEKFQFHLRQQNLKYLCKGGEHCVIYWLKFYVQWIGITWFLCEESDPFHSNFASQMKNIKKICALHKIKIETMRITSAKYIWTLCQVKFGLHIFMNNCKIA